jgi:hypothetical protein
VDHIMEVLHMVHITILNHSLYWFQQSLVSQLQLWLSVYHVWWQYLLNAAVSSGLI